MNDEFDKFGKSSSYILIFGQMQRNYWKFHVKRDLKSIEKESTLWNALLNLSTIQIRDRPHFLFALRNRGFLNCSTNSNRTEPKFHLKNVNHTVSNPQRIFMEKRKCKIAWTGLKAVRFGLVFRFSGWTEPEREPSVVPDSNIKAHRQLYLSLEPFIYWLDLVYTHLTWLTTREITMNKSSKVQRKRRATFRNTCCRQRFDKYSFEKRVNLTIYYDITGAYVATVYISAIFC